MGAESEAEQQRKETIEKPRAIPTITSAQFLSWKRRKDGMVAERRSEAARKREEGIAAGTVQMNGRELFLHEPWVFDNSRY